MSSRWTSVRRNLTVCGPASVFSPISCDVDGPARSVRGSCAGPGSVDRARTGPASTSFGVGIGVPVASTESFSVKTSVVLPTMISSSSSRGFSATWMPFTYVPFVEPRSLMK